jgi:hypothetical protein
VNIVEPFLLVSGVVSAVLLIGCVIVELRSRYKASRKAYLADLMADADASVVEQLRKAGVL